MNNNSWHKKEKPLMGLMGTGGGAQGNAAPSPIDATGGTKATPGDGYIYHLFTSSGSLVINSGNKEMDVLIVGGGAGGGFDRGGGGGAGAFRPETLEGASGTHPITIGAAGNGGSGSPGGTNGGDTTLTYDSAPYIAGGGGTGGGTGGSSPNGTDGTYGGSGGGAGYSGSAGQVGGPSPYAPYGNPGKLSLNISPTMYAMGGGGGGAGSGASPTVANPYPYTGPGPYNVPGWNNASDGKTLPWIPTAYGVDGNFCGGGAGGGGNGAGWGSNTPTAQKAGAGRGAAPNVEGTGAAANTGSGGGGGSGSTSPENPSQAGNNGSNGVVLFRYSAT